MTSPESGPASPDELYEGHPQANEYAKLAEEFRVSRGDRWFPADGERGFRIVRERLSSGPRPVETLYPLAFQADRLTVAETDKVLGRDMATRIAREDEALFIAEGAEDDTNHGDTYLESSDLEVKVEFAINPKAYEAAVAAGVVEAGLFDQGGAISGSDSRSEGLLDLVDRQDEISVMAEALEEQGNLEDLYVDDLLENFDPEELTELRDVLEAFEFSDAGRTVRLVNFSGHALSDEQLVKVTNALRSMSDKSGGAIFDELTTIAIFPEEHSSFIDDKADGLSTRESSGYVAGSVIVLSDYLVKKPGDYPITRRVQGVPELIGPEALDVALLHELSHVIRNMNNAETTARQHRRFRRISKGQPAPTWYGRRSTDEYVAELDTAEYVGGKQNREVSPEQRQALDDVWDQQRGFDPVQSATPIGPRFVTCRQMNLARGETLLRINEPPVSVLVDSVYRLESSGE